MRIAVVSTDGEMVNEHFGRAGRFLIYDVVGPLQRLVEVRQVEPLSTGDKNHPFDAGRLGTVIETVLDCQRLYCAMIGEIPQQELQRQGILPVVGERTIATITT